MAKDAKSNPKEPKSKASMVVVGERIRQLRGEERQDDFAVFLGIAQGQLSKIERGRLAPSVEVLLRLRERFGRSVDWILTGRE